MVLKLIRNFNLKSKYIKTIILGPTIEKKLSLFGGKEVGDSLRFEDIGADCQSSGAKVIAVLDCIVERKEMVDLRELNLLSFLCERRCIFL